MCNHVVNGLYVPCIATVAPPSVGNLVINAGVSSAEATAGWQVAELLIWNRQLSVPELVGVTKYWQSTYALDWFTGSCAAPAHRFMPSASPGPVTSVTASPVLDTGVAPVAWSSLTAYGGCTYDATGGALQFNGAANTYASFGNLTLAGDSLTVALWVRYDTFQGGSERVYELATGANSGSFFGSTLSVGTYPAGYIRASAVAATISASCQAPTALPAGTWAHIATVFSGATSTVTLYINGAFACRASTPGVLGAALNATIPAAYAALGKSSSLPDKVRCAYLALVCTHFRVALTTGAHFFLHAVVQRRHYGCSRVHVRACGARHSCAIRREWRVQHATAACPAGDEEPGAHRQCDPELRVLVYGLSLQPRVCNRRRVWMRHGARHFAAPVCYEFRACMVDG